MWPISLIVGNSYGVVFPVISTLAFCYVSFNVFKWMVGDMTVPISNSSNHHSWRSIRITAKAWYCSMCESLLVSGFGVYCDCCGVCADQDCVKRVDRKLTCKSNMSVQKNMPHHWVKGNLPLGALCHVCDEDCSMEPGLVDYQCCWCQRCVHTSCLSVVGSQPCDFGANKCLIVPPWCVQVARRKSSVRKKFQIRTVSDPDWPDWSPLIVMGNCKSGNGDGGLVLSEFRRLLNPAQVFDLSEHSPNTALQWCRLVAPYPTKLLVAGGDGTVAWILNTVHKMGINPNPGVAIVPLGTGNDMSRVLGWGREHGVDSDLDDLVGKLQKAETRPFDRWKVDVTPRPTLRLRMPAKHLYMYNYLSVGVDAQVALDFHRTRESRLYLFSNRIFNKLLYLCFGTHQVVAAGCRNLEQRVELYLDGERTTIPEVEAIVVLNISSWGAGVNLWGMVTTGGEDSQSYNDGKLEVVGIYSSFHMAQLQVGLATPHRIGQAREVSIKLLAAAPVQVDGEPWEQHPSTILVSRDESANVLVCSEILHESES